MDNQQRSFIFYMKNVQRLDLVRVVHYKRLIVEVVSPKFLFLE
uniref:Uncharacterized protein n=1 Tax=Myoviridae sp. ctJ2i1 TaxID=2825079 RepID=A0A8S5V1K7_9CAUD|nr:MAG TPA: hypothetical protein [Myoviridae sp. ctJ2i1]